MVYFYAQINPDGIVFAVSQLANIVEDPSLIHIQNYDETLLGKRYNPTTQQFEEAQPQE